MICPNCGTEFSNDAHTKREHDVLQGLLKGQSNKVIANELDLAETTIKLYVRNLLRKSGARSRLELVVKHFTEQQQHQETASV